MREFREVRKDLGGDEAAPYIGAARTLLGQLKNQMQLGGLLQLRRSVTLPDGATITVESRFGQDTVRIIPPLTAGGAVPVSTPLGSAPETLSPEPFDTSIPWAPSYVAVGGAWNNTIGLSGIYWPNENVVGIDVGTTFGNADVGQYLSSVTADGHAAVGWGGDNGVYYTRSGGLQDIYAPGVIYGDLANGGSTAFSISYSGNEVGVCTNISAYSLGYVWNPKTKNYVYLPQVSVPTQVASQFVVMSGSGKIAAARGPDGAVEAALIIDMNSLATVTAIDGARIYALDYAGTIYGGCTGVSTPNPVATLWTPQGAITFGIGKVEGVSADGTVACGTLGTSPYATTGFIWTKSKGMISLGPQTAAHCVSPCGTAIGGANASQPVVWDIHGNPKQLALPAGPYIAYPMYNGVMGLAQRAPLTWLGQGDTAVQYPG